MLPLPGTRPGHTGKRREARKEFVVVRAGPQSIIEWWMAAGKTCAGDYIWLRDQGRSLLNMMEETQLGQNCSPVPGSDNIGTMAPPGPQYSPAQFSWLRFVTRDQTVEDSWHFLDSNFMLLNKIGNGQIIQIVFHQNHKSKKNVKISFNQNLRNNKQPESVSQTHLNVKSDWKIYFWRLVLLASLKIFGENGSLSKFE